MGRAIVREPQVFLMDEPLSNLDAKLRVQTRAEIAALQNRLGITTVYVTHDQVEAMTMGDRVAVLKDGILQQVDTPRALRPPGQRLRGRLHRLARDEPAHGAGPGRGRDVRQPAVPLPPDALQSYRQAGVQEVTLGVRPESFEVAGEDGEPVHVDVVEELGSDAFVYGRVALADGEKHLVVRHDARRPPAKGDTLKLKIRTDELHVFHPETGARFSA
jgi:multiple sugar transport system ATP-binding protein